MQQSNGSSFELFTIAYTTNVIFGLNLKQSYLQCSKTTIASSQQHKQ